MAIGRKTAGVKVWYLVLADVKPTNSARLRAKPEISVRRRSCSAAVGLASGGDGGRLGSPIGPGGDADPVPGPIGERPVLLPFPDHATARG